jgi:tetratricopeptide (TPR) repeat protein
MIRVVAIAAAAVAACSAPALQRDLARAEEHEKAGRYQLALASYQTAQQSCKKIRKPYLRRRTCAQAHTHRAELLEDLDRLEEAARAYEAVPAAVEGDPVPSAKSLYRAGRLRLELGQDERAYRLLWKAVTDFPDVAFSVDALRLVFNDGRRRNPAQLYRVLSGLIEPLAGNDVSDNILYDMATLAEQEMKQPALARSHLDAIIERYPDGGLFDEACWHAARLSRELGDPKGAVRRLKTLLATREVALGAGSYFSIWLDNAQLELGIVLRDGLSEPRAAVRAFRQLPRDYPDSILRDDALFESAVALRQAGERDQACRALAELARTWPDSKYELERAPALRRELACAGPDRAAETP